MLRQFLLFATVGGVAAIAHFGVLIALVEGTGMAPVFASMWGFLAAVAVSYLLNRRFTFRSDRPHRSAAPRFLAVSVGGFLLNAFMMWLLTEPVSAPYLIAQVVATLVVLFWNFAANRWWTFRTN